MNAEQHVPQFRFKDFSDSWEQRSFKTLYKKVIEKNDLSFESDRIISVANMYYKPNDSKSDEKYMETYNIFRLGDIAFEGHKSKNFAYGRFVENTIGDGIVSHVFDVFRPISEYDLNYWKYFIHYEDIMGQKLRMSTTKATMMNNLVSKDFLKQSVLVPNLDEQQKIGTFFKQLDHLIALHQRKLAKLKELKKGYLQKLFPQNSEKVPEFRFKGYSDAWEKRKVSDYLCESRIPGSNGLKAKKLTVKLWGKGVVPKNETYSGSIKTKYYVRSANQLIYGKLDFLHAAFGIVPQSLDGWESTIDSPAFDVNTSIGNAAFLLALFLKPNFYLREGIRANGSRKAKRIHEDTFLSMSISAPQRKEQNQIAMVLDKTEFLIAATQCKLDLLKKLKKGYLQKMFC